MHACMYWLLLPSIPEQGLSHIKRKLRETLLPPCCAQLLVWMAVNLASWCELKTVPNYGRLIRLALPHLGSAMQTIQSAAFLTHAHPFLPVMHFWETIYSGQGIISVAEDKPEMSIWSHLRYTRGITNIPEYWIQQQYSKYLEPLHIPQPCCHWLGSSHPNNQAPVPQKQGGQLQNANCLLFS